MRLFSILAACSFAASAYTEPNRRLAAVRISSPPKIDGILQPEEWAQASKTSGFVHVASGQRTEFDANVFVAYDANNLYVAFDCPDPTPKLIRATEYRRNASVDGDDHTVILLNLFKTHQSGDQNEFRVGAGGGLTASFAGGRSAKREWEGEWDAKSRITERGWECEYVIPWKILRLPPSGSRDIEVNFARYIPRNQTAIAWCEIGPQERMQNNGFLTGVEVPSVSHSREILALPYQIIGYNDERKEEVFNTGIDLRYSVTPQISSLASINPDFQNVEGAVLNLAFSRFERLAEERRPFFVEGASEFRLGGMSAQLFAPQRLKSFDFGAKAFGKLSDTQSFGAMVTTRFEGGTAAVGRFRQTWGKRSYLNAGFVYWNDQDNDVRNSVGSLELIEWRGNWGADFIWNGTEDESAGNGRRMDVDLMYQDDNTFAAIGYQEISDNFLPRIGFAPVTGFKGISSTIFHSREFATGPWSELGFELSMVDRDKYDGGGQFLNENSFWIGGTTRSACEIDLWYSDSEYLGEKASLTGVEVEYPENNPYRNMSFSYEGGRVDGESYGLWSLAGNYRFPNRITITPSFQLERHGNDENTLGLLSVGYELDKNRSLAGRIVVRDDDANWYLAYRHSGNIGTEWFVIVGDPNATSFQKKLVVKAVIPITLRL